MVKSPKIRHSKSSTEPVTIDLNADEVSRIPPEQSKPTGASDAATAKPAEPGKTARTPQPEPSTATPAKPDAPARAAEQPARSSPPDGSKAETQPKQTEPKTTPGGGGSAFGRDATSKPSAPPPPPSPRPEAAARRGGGSLIAAGLLGGAVVLAGAAGAWYGGLLPAPQGAAVTAGAGESDALRAELEALRSEVAELRAAPPVTAGDGIADANARIESVSVLVEEMRAQLSQLAEGAAENPADQSALNDLRSALAALEQRVATLPAEGGGTDAEALRSEIARVEEGVRAAVDTAASASEAASAAGPRIDALEQRLTEMAARVEEQDKTPGVAIAIAASALKAAIDRGTPFTTELETFAGLAPEAPEVAALRDMAASGVPTRSAIAAETDAAAVRMIEAGRVVDPNAGFLDRLWASAQSLVTVRPIGEVEGSDVPAVVARWEAALEAGDYGRAIAEYETLPADAKGAGAAFMDKVRARHSADRLVDQTLAAALRA